MRSHFHTQGAINHRDDPSWEHRVSPTNGGVMTMTYAFVGACALAFFVTRVAIKHDNAEVVAWAPILTALFVSFALSIDPECPEGALIALFINSGTLTGIAWAGRR